MEREIRVAYTDGVLGFESTNAPGAQIAPGSHEVREDLQEDTLGHGPELPTDSETVASLRWDLWAASVCGVDLPWRKRGNLAHYFRPQ